MKIGQQAYGYKLGGRPIVITILEFIPDGALVSSPDLPGQKIALKTSEIYQEKSSVYIKIESHINLLRLWQTEFIKQ
jgi:hypothetical protein